MPLYGTDNEMIEEEKYYSGKCNQEFMIKQPKARFIFTLLIS